MTFKTCQNIHFHPVRVLCGNEEETGNLRCRELKIHMSPSDLHSASAWPHNPACILWLTWPIVMLLPQEFFHCVVTPLLTPHPVPASGPCVLPPLPLPTWASGSSLFTSLLRLYPWPIFSFISPFSKMPGAEVCLSGTALASQAQGPGSQVQPPPPPPPKKC